MLNFVICLDATGSMGSSIEAVKSTISTFTKFQDILNIRIIVVVFGDYDRQIKNLDDVFIVIQNPNLDQKIQRISLSCCGSGRDGPEAHASALHIAFRYDPDHIVFLTDASPHRFYYNIGPGQNISDDGSNASREHEVLGGETWSTLVTKAIDEGITIWSINSNRGGGSGYFLNPNGTKFNVNGPLHIPGQQTDEDTVFYNPTLTTKFVIISLMKLINTFAENTVKTNVPPQTFFDIFWYFVEYNPEALEHLQFLSKTYYNAVKKGKLQDQHGRKFQTIRSSGLPQGIIDALEEFTNNQYESTDFLEVLDKYTDGPRIVHAADPESLPPPKKLTDFFTSSIPTQMKRLATSIKTVYPRQPGYDEGFPVNALKEEYTACFPGLATNHGGNIPELKGVLGDFMATLAIWNTDNIIASMAFIYILTGNFQDWLCKDSEQTPPPSCWMVSKMDLLKLAFQRSIANVEKAVTIMGTGPIDTSKASEKLDTLKRLRAIMRLTNYSQYVSNSTGTLSLEGLTEEKVVHCLDYLPMAWCPLLMNMFPVTITFKQTHTQVCQIILRLRHESFFKPDSFRWTDQHLCLLEELSRENKGLYLSIYAINCYVRDQLHHPIEAVCYGYQDVYAKNSYLSQEYTYRPDTPKKFQNIFENTQGKTIRVGTSEVSRNGPEPHLCSKCTCVYIVHDTSHGDAETKKCGVCRKGFNHFPVFRRECTDCKRGFVSGMNDKPVNPRNCIYCNSKGVKTFTSDQVEFLNHIIRPNSGIFSTSLGIPEILIEKFIVSGGSMAKMFRENPRDADTSKPLGNFLEIYNPRGWNKKHASMDELSIIINGITMNMDPNTLERVKEIIDNGGRRNCCFCFETLPSKNLYSLCKNKRCVTETCGECIGGLFAGIRPGTIFSKQHVGCAFCNSGLKSGLLKEHSGPLSCKVAGEARTSILENPQNKYGLCEELDNGCVSENPYFSINAACGAADEEDTYEPGSRRCEDCVARLFVPPAVIPDFPIEGSTPGNNGFCWVDETPYRQCPTEFCGAVYTHTGGCFHMDCICGADICWGCGQKFPSSDIYRHLSECRHISDLAEHPDSVRLNYSWYMCEGHNPDTHTGEYDDYDYY